MVLSTRSNGTRSNGTRSNRKAIAPLIAGLALAATTFLAAPAQAASAPAKVTATLAITLTGATGYLGRPADTVMTQINGTYTCYQNFAVGVRKTIAVTVPKGQWVQVFSSHSCYDSVVISGTYVTAQGQDTEFTL